MDGFEAKTVKIGEKLVSSIGSDNHATVFQIMKQWNQLKDEMQDGRVIPNYGERNADNFARAGAGIVIGQLAAKTNNPDLIDAASDLSKGREFADSLRKIFQGKNIKETINDSKKDHENLKRAMELGRQYPNADPLELLSHLDLEINKFTPGYNNGYADLLRNKYPFGKKNPPAFTEQEGELINKLIKVDKTCSSFGQAQGYIEIAHRMVANHEAPDLTSAVSQLQEIKNTLTHEGGVFSPENAYQCIRKADQMVTQQKSPDFSSAISQIIQEEKVKDEMRLQAFRESIHPKNNPIIEQPNSIASTPTHPELALVQERTLRAKNTMNLRLYMRQTAQNEEQTQTEPSLTTARSNNGSQLIAQSDYHR